MGLRAFSVSFERKSVPGQQRHVGVNNTILLGKELAHSKARFLGGTLPRDGGVVSSLLLEREVSEVYFLGGVAFQLRWRFERDNEMMSNISVSDWKKVLRDESV